MATPNKSVAQIFSFTEKTEGKLQKEPPKKFFRMLETLFKLRRLQNIYEEIGHEMTESHFASRVLQYLGITCCLEHHEISERIPAEGPVIVVANHPFGGVEGLILLSLLSNYRTDVKVLGNQLLKRIPELATEVIAVDLFSGKKSSTTNMRALRESKRHLDTGGLLIIFPAGEVSSFKLSKWEIADPAWFRSLEWLIKKTGADVLPIYFDGRNSVAFQVAGLIHPRLKTALLPNELLNKKNKTIHLEIGQIISNKRLAEITHSKQLIDYLRFRTYLLKQRIVKTQKKEASRTQQPIAPPVPSAELWQDIFNLPSGQLLASSGHLTVYYGYAHQLPNVLPELGRLREMTFRNANEGSGKARDIDQFDDDYLHVFVWHDTSHEIIGAYRMGDVQAIYTAKGAKGLYTSSLFSYRKMFFETIGPSLEMGRSFIRPEFQNSFGPLLLLWKGIGQYIARHPQYRILFGPVSISRSYSDFSRQLIAASLQKNFLLPDLARHVKPHRPLKIHTQSVKGCAHDAVSDFVDNIDEVSRLIGDIEVNEKDIPVLLKFYLTLGCKFLAFNEDPLFGDVLDGLVLVDLLETDCKTIRRYMGEKGAQSFINYHHPQKMSVAV
nr:lysophospholipid acyltransferase family protein [Desulfobulbaceae bacterium]